MKDEIPTGSGKTFSMGAAVEYPICPACESAHDPTHPHSPDHSTLLGDLVRSHYVTIVPSPLCEECKVAMVRHDATAWVCAQVGCVGQDKPVPAHLSGIYPFTTAG